MNLKELREIAERELPNSTLGKIAERALPAAKEKLTDAIPRMDFSLTFDPLTVLRLIELAEKAEQDNG